MSSGRWPLPEERSAATEASDQSPGPLPQPSLRLTAIFVGVLVLGLLAGWLLGDTDTTRAAVGSPAPDFSVETMDGAEFSLAEHLADDGRPLVVNLWASWCIPCRTEIPAISAYSSNHPEVKVLGIAVEDREENARAFAEDIDASYDLALGNTDFEDAYPRLGLPVTYVIDGDGTVKRVHNGIVDEAELVELVGENP